MYEETTRNIRVAVEPSFLDDQSEPGENRYVWSYKVTIENNGERQIQVVQRYWKIVDSQGRVREVRGAGVIGEQPVIAPGKSYQYSSGAPLETPSGFMSGTYRVRASDGESFEIAIPMFALESPHEKRQLH